MLKFVILSSILVAVSSAIELTFELPDNANQCFYEDLKKDVDTVFEFQVSIFDRKFEIMVLRWSLEAITTWIW